MVNQPTYIIAVVFSSVTMFAIWLAYKFLVPMFNMTVTPLASLYPAMVGNDPTYVDGFNTIASETNILFQYSFIVMMLGVMSIFVLIYAYRNVFGQTQIGADESI